MPRVTKWTIGAAVTVVAALAMLTMSLATAGSDSGAVSVTVQFAGVLSVSMANTSPDFGSLAAGAKFGTLDSAVDGLNPVVVTNDPDSVTLTMLTIQATADFGDSPSTAEFNCATGTDWELEDSGFTGASDEVNLIAATDGDIGGGLDQFVVETVARDLMDNTQLAPNASVDVDFELRMDSVYTDAGISCQAELTITAIS